jgi:hypothetical protein
MPSPENKIGLITGAPLSTLKIDESNWNGSMSTFVESCTGSPRYCRGWKLQGYGHIINVASLP